MYSYMGKLEGVHSSSLHPLNFELKNCRAGKGSGSLHLYPREAITGSCINRAIKAKIKQPP